MKEVCKAYLAGWEPTTCDPPARAPWWVINGHEMACRGPLTYRPTKCCCHCSYVTVLEKGPFWASALPRLKLVSQSCTELVVEQMGMTVWRNEQLEILTQNHRFDYSLQSWGELQIWIQTSQLQPAIKQTYLYNGFNSNYIWVSVISGKVWRHIWLEMFKHHLIFANSILKKKPKKQKPNQTRMQEC